MKNRKSKNTEPDISGLQWVSAEKKKAVYQFQTKLLESNISEALFYWLQEARNSFQDRGTISNYYAYINDLLARGIFSYGQTNSYIQVRELNDFYGTCSRGIPANM